MDFIEQWFGISPDGGSGATELLFLVVALLIVAIILARRRIAPSVGRNFLRRQK
jgi:hypothetical protein